MKAKEIISAILIISLSILSFFNASIAENVFAGNTYGIISNKSSICFYGEELKCSKLDNSYELYNCFKNINSETTDIVYYLEEPIELVGSTQAEITTQNMAVFESVYNSVQIALDAFIKDYPEVFWIDYGKTTFSQTFSYDYDSDGNKRWYISNVKIMFVNYENFTDINDVCDKVYSKAQSIIASSSSRSIYSKLKDYHDYLCENITYNSDCENLRDIYGGLINGQGVCEAYAEGFKFLCDLSGIPCISVMGQAGLTDAKDNHIWNYCYMDDGKWYAVDVTWDDQPGLKQSIIYDHFLCGCDTIGKYTKLSFDYSHIPSGDFSSTGIYSFTYPELNLNKYIYLPFRTASPEPSATITPTPMATTSLIPTETPSLAPTVTPSPVPTATPSPVPTATPGPTPTVIPTSEPTETPTPMFTPIYTPISTDSPITETPSITESIMYGYGDLNADGVISAEDALLVLKHASKLTILYDRDKLLFADLDANNVVDANDALIILKIAAKLL